MDTQAGDASAGAAAAPAPSEEASNAQKVQAACAPIAVLAVAPLAVQQVTAPAEPLAPALLVKDGGKGQGGLNDGGGGTIKVHLLKPDVSSRLGLTLVTSDETPQIHKIAPDGIAAGSGQIQVGQLLYAVNGVRVKDSHTGALQLKAAKKGTVELTLSRNVVRTIAFAAKAKASWAELSLKARDGSNPVLARPSVARIIKDQKEKMEEALKNSIARQTQVPKPTLSTWQCLMWTVGWVWAKARKDVVLIVSPLLFVSAWAVVEAYLVSWMVGSLSSSEDLLTSLIWVAIFGGSLLLGNLLELQSDYFISTHIPLVKNAMKVLVTTHLSRVSQEMLDASRESDFKAVLLIELQKLQSNVVALFGGIRNLVKVAAYLSTLYSISPQLAGVATLIIPVALCVSASRSGRIERVNNAQQVQEMKFEGVLSESIAAISTRKTLGAVDLDAAEVQKAGKATGARSRAVRKVDAQDARVMGLLLTLTNVCVLVLGTVLVKLTGLPISKSA